MESISLSTLVAARIEAKRAEDAAVKARREVDAQIAEFLKDPAKLEGSVSQKLAEGYKVTVTYKLDRKVDTDALKTGWKNSPSTCKPLSSGRLTCPSPSSASSTTRLSSTLPSSSPPKKHHPRSPSRPSNPQEYHNG